MAARGCGGSRTIGRIYIVTKLSPVGTPLHKFILDPPIPVPAGMDLPFRGVAIRERPDGSGIYDVYDHVGSEHYPNVMDFILEVARMGLSRGVSKHLDFSKLTPESRIFLAHERAVITNHQALYRALATERSEYPAMADRMDFQCITFREDHEELAMALDDAAPCCAGLWMHDVRGGDDVYDPDAMPRTVTRTVGSTTYTACKPLKEFTPEYQRGFFMALPISGLEVVKAKDGSHEDAVNHASESGLNVEEVDE